MKSDLWYIVILHSYERIRTVRVKKRTIVILGGLGILFLLAASFFTYGYFSLRAEKGGWLLEQAQLKNQIDGLERQVKKHYLNTLPPKPASPPLGIQDLKIVRRTKGRGVSVSFRLVNQFAKDYPVGGTFFIVAKNETKSPPIYLMKPEGELVKGVPQHPEKGKGFEVRTHKYVETFFESIGEEPLKKMTIYVYGQNGKLMLELTQDIPEKATED